VTRPVSVSTVAYDGYPLGLAFEQIASLGFALLEPAFIKGYLEFSEDDFEAKQAARLRKLMSDCGLGALAISAHMDQGHPEAPDMMARRLRFASEIGAKIVITNSTTIERRPALRRMLDANMPVAENLDLIIALENPGSGRTNLMTGGISGAKLIASIGHPRVKMNYDVGNTLTCSEGAIRPEDDIAEALPFCANVHLKTFTRLADRWRPAALGEGEIDSRRINLALAGYSNLPVTIELPLRMIRLFGADPQRQAEPPPTAAILEALRESKRSLPA
jgi:sugar phosphate isomerase/epimerase